MTIGAEMSGVQSRLWSVVDAMVPPKLRCAGADQLRRARLAVLVGQIAAVSLVGSIVSALALKLDPLVLRGNFLSLILFGLHPWLFRRVSSVAIFSNALLLMGLLQQSFLLFGYGGSNLGSLFSMPLVPLVAMLLSGPLSALFFMALSIVAIVALKFLPASLFFALPADALRPSTMVIRDAVLITIGVTSFGALYEAVRSATLREADLARQRAEQSERTFAKAFVANPECLLIASLLDGSILDCNQGFLDAVGLASRNDAVGRGYEEFLVSDAGLSSELAGLGSRQPIVRFECRTVGPVKEARTFVAAATRIEIEGEERLLVAAVDDTERRAGELRIRQLSNDLERRVKVRTVELERAVQELESFSYSVSHDLRAPVRTIASFADLIFEDFADGLPREALDYLGRIRGAAGRMGDLIDTLLGLSRLSQRKLDPQETDLAAIAQEVVAELREREPDRDLHFESPRELLQFVDPSLTRVVLVNLLANAWKFTRDVEGAKVEFLRVGDADSEVVTYEVRDNGIGFDMDDSATMFRPFQRVHTGETFEGSGIGLATVERAIGRQGGRVWAQGEPGVGASFFFSLPKAGLLSAEEPLSA